jgi:phospholipid-binding lipoprotein MlaA
MKPGIFGDAAPAAKLLSATAFLPRSATLFSLLVLAACAQVPTEPEALAAYNEENDPAEPINRTVFAANQWVDRNALRPVAEVYQEYVPDGVRKRVRNFSANLKEPTVLVNDLLQANVTRAWNTTQRFAVNTTVGGAGLFDVATDWDLPHHNADLGQTFGVWEMGPGPSVQTCATLLARWLGFS